MPSDSPASHQPSHAADSPSDCTFSGASIATQGTMNTAPTKLQITQPRSIGMAQLTRRPTRNSSVQRPRGFAAVVRSGRGSRVASSAAANSSARPATAWARCRWRPARAPASAGPTSRPLACAVCCRPSARDRPAGGTSSVTMLLMAGMHQRAGQHRDGLDGDDDVEPVVRQRGERGHRGSRRAPKPSRPTTIRLRLEWRSAKGDSSGSATNDIADTSTP